MDIKRNNCCPKCGSNLIARIWKIIYCLDNNCDWAIQSKRKEDLEIKTINEQADNWHN
jgi:hypothetical protein